MTTSSPCPAFTWTGREPSSLMACDRCTHRAWDHDRRLNPQGTAVPWPPGLVGYWMSQDLITRDRGLHLRSLRAPTTPAATP